MLFLKHPVCPLSWPNENVRDLTSFTAQPNLSSTAPNIMQHQNEEENNDQQEEYIN